MAHTASDQLVERLVEWGVKQVYGYPGDGINGLMGAMRRHQDRIEFVQTRHEELAAFMACGHAKWSDGPGVCMATSGPGAIHLLNGLYDAKMDHQPVVAIVGQQATSALGSDYQQEVDLVSLFKDVAHHFVHMASNPAQIRHLVDRAFRIALAERTVTCIIVPNDVQEMDAVDSPPRKHGTTFSGVGWRPPRVMPREDDLHKAADVLNEGKRVAILVGAGARGAHRELAEVADLLGAGVAKALLGKDVLPDDLPWVTGAIGLLGTRPSWDLMMDCDTLFMIGTSFPYSEFLPKEGSARGVQVDISPRSLSLRYPMEVNLQGDARETLKALLPLLARKTDRGWREGIEKGVADWWDLMESRAMKKADPINPQRVFWELSSRLPEDAVLAADSGSGANWYARDVRIRGRMRGSLSGGLATMCPAMPYALAAKFVFPDRPVVAMVGDGAMQMLGNNALISVAHYWRRWEDPRLVVLVLNNRDLNQVTWEQRVMEGDPKFRGSQVLPAFSFAGYAELLGLGALEVRRPEDLGPAWENAFHADRPVVLDVHTDPETPPLPPHIKFDQAKAFLSSIIGGDPKARQMIEQSVRQGPGAWFTRGRR